MYVKVYSLLFESAIVSKFQSVLYVKLKVLVKLSFIDSSFKSELKIYVFELLNITLYFQSTNESCALYTEL